MLKTIFKEEESKLYKYRDQKKKIDGTAFHTDLQSKLEEGPKIYQNFEETFVRDLDVHGPRKTFKVLRGNHKPHADKNFLEAIMKHSTLKQNFNILIIQRHQKFSTFLG